jgi:hypothetical protein
MNEEKLNKIDEVDEFFRMNHGLRLGKFGCYYQLILNDFDVNKTIKYLHDRYILRLYDVTD